MCFVRLVRLVRKLPFVSIYKFTSAFSLSFTDKSTPVYCYTLVSYLPYIYFTSKTVHLSSLNAIILSPFFPPFSVSLSLWTSLTCIIMHVLFFSFCCDTKRYCSRSSSGNTQKILAFLKRFALISGADSEANMIIDVFHLIQLCVLLLIWYFFPSSFSLCDEKIGCWNVCPRTMEWYEFCGKICAQFMFSILFAFSSWLFLSNYIDYTQ